MKTFATLIVAFGLIQNVMAVPRSMTLTSPTKIEILHKKQLIRLTFKLKCENEYALDWSKVVMTNDDEGDQAVSIGLVYSLDNCKSTDSVTSYELLVNPKDYGYTINGVPGGFQAMHLAD